MIHTNQRIIKHKVGLLNLAKELGNISHACKTMGVSGKFLPHHCVVRFCFKAPVKSLNIFINTGYMYNYNI